LVETKSEIEGDVRARLEEGSLMTRVIVIGAIVVVAVVGAAVMLWLRSGPDASQYADLADPRIRRTDDQRVLVVEVAGDPNVVGARAFKLLFNAYYKTEGVTRGRMPPAPRARWPQSVNTPRTQWVGRYAMPVPREVAAAPSVPVDAGFRLSVETWEYGEVAEVLHVGPYCDEQADIDRLHKFVAASGRHVIGDHEEEYVRGPGIIFAGDPQKYLTIIRLRVAL
jgi:hypothetical protein